MDDFHGPSIARVLCKNQFGGVIFGCKQATISECLCKKLFGLPSSHYMYVKNIEPGLPRIETFKRFIAFNSVQKDTIEELKASNAAQKETIDHLKQKIAFLENDLAEAQAEIKNLKGVCVTLELESYVEVNDIELNEISLPDDPILLIGGYDGGSWLSSLDCYSVSQNVTKSLTPMNTERCKAAVSKLDGELFMFGGESHGHCFDTVESYNPADDRWTTCPL
ncbi:uncharacterized protein LOC143612750 [Bidens hawaiensis]|uniref:uncharacterized protein LOC143612750 n=1 Tax=Bidens hawaiensis TaxID=980011 RepID=UPI00404B1D7E